MKEQGLWSLTDGDSRFVKKHPSRPQFEFAQIWELADGSGYRVSHEVINLMDYKQKDIEECIVFGGYDTFTHFKEEVESKDFAFRIAELLFIMEQSDEMLVGQVVTMDFIEACERLIQITGDVFVNT